MAEKQYDLFANLLENEDTSFGDLMLGGLNIENTLLLDKATYAKNPEVQEKFKNQAGLFDQAAFDTFYNNARTFYNGMSGDLYNKVVKQQLSYHRDNIFAPADLRRNGPEFTEQLEGNPYHITNSIVELGHAGERTKSIDELAQENRVLLNPLEAGLNLENAKWGDSADGNFFGYLGSTLVMAQYDKDGYHQDPITGKVVEHKAGDLKTDNDGNFYYEKLAGRDIYNRRVLNKMNTLTKDGSWANQFDFFDSDDLKEKSIAGSVMKNLALVGTMFIPYVGPWVTGLSIGTQVAGMGATLGKMLTGSDSPIFSEIEGWAKSWNPQLAKTEYAQQNTLCWENFINLIGDTTKQLAEQRWIFEKVPTLLLGTNLLSKEGLAAKFKELLAGEEKLYASKIKDLKDAGQLAEYAKLSKTIPALNANRLLETLTKNFLKLGRDISMGYMTAITVGDTYGEAKAAGASDLDATLLTLGYAAGEWAILSKGLGELILPEVRTEGLRNKAIARAVLNLNNPEFKASLNLLKDLSIKDGKREYMRKLFNFGKDIARGTYATGAKTASAIGAAALGEGVEEVGEEFLADFSKGCFDVVKWLQGDDTRLDSFGYNFKEGRFDTKELLERYGMSFFGGIIGGGIANAATTFKEVRSYNELTPDAAIKEIVNMSRNKLLDGFLKSVDKIDLGDKHLSATDVQDNEGNLTFGEGTATNNLDYYAKQAIKLQVKMIDDILKANGAKVSDQSFLAKLTEVLQDLRYNALHDSTMAGAYLQEFNDLSSKIVTITNQINALGSVDINGDGVVTDREKRTAEISQEDLERVKTLQSQLKETLKSLSDLVEGKRSPEFIRDALFEMTTELSSIFKVPNFLMFVENRTGKKYVEVSDETKENLRQEYADWKTNDGRDQIRTMSLIYYNVAKLTSDLLKQHADTYSKQYDELNNINLLLDRAYNVTATDEEFLGAADAVAKTLDMTVGDLLVKTFGSEQEQLELAAISNEIGNIDLNLSPEDKLSQMQNINKLYLDKLLNIISDNLETYVQPFIKNGFVNKETRDRLMELTRKASNYNHDKIAQLSTLVITDEVKSLLEYYNKNISKLNTLLTEISNLSNTPIATNLDLFSLAIGNKPIKLSELQEKIEQNFLDSLEDISKFAMDDDAYKALQTAINTLDMYKAAILGARNNAAGIGNYFGYNSTVNEVAKDKLAEIDSKVADIFINDINTIASKLKYLERLFNINRGLKLAKLDNISVKKDLLIYNQLKKIVDVPDDWKDGGLKAAIEGATKHQNLVSNNSLRLSKEDRIEFEKETIAMEDAIYNFFQENADKLKDPSKLAEIINPKKLDLYTNAKSILNENSDSIDDNAFVWYLASRAAVKSSDFYYQYKQIIDTTSNEALAPIATQEAAIYNSYASIVNGLVFDLFTKALRQSMIADWNERSIDERTEILRHLGIDELTIQELSLEKYAKYAINFLPIPKYSNIMFIEGIAGAGKSTGVFKPTIKLIKQFHPEILEKVAVVHGIEEGNRAEALKNSIGLPDSDAYSRSDFMKRINSNWKEYIKNENNVYDIPRTDAIITGENEIISSLKVDADAEPYKLIIIDEITKFTGYDIDLILQYATAHGITVITAGDFDLSGVYGTHPIKLDGIGETTLYVNSARTHFIRSPKLGVSMRTDNLLKTTNLLKMQAYMQNPDETSINFEYYLDETGIYGDKVHAYVMDVEESDPYEQILDNVLADVDALIKTLQPNEKIGFIYKDLESAIYKALSDEKYKDFFDFKGPGSAQGLESRYYVIEADPNQPTEVYLRDLYTGITRALQGSIVVVDSDAPAKLDTKQVNSLVTEPLGIETIKKYAAKRKELLDSIVTDGKVTPVTPRETVETVEVKTKEKKEGLDEAVDTDDSIPPPPDYNEIKTKVLDDISKATTVDELNNLVNGTVVENDKEVLEAKTAKEAELRHVEPLEVLTQDVIPDDIKEDIQKCIEAAKANPRTDNGLDPDDSATELKYGDVVRIGEDDDAEYLVVVGVKSGNFESYELLNPKTPKENDWGYESWPYFRKRITGIIKDIKEPPEEKQKAAPLTYEEDKGPQLDNDLDRDTQYQEKVLASNEDTPKEATVNAEGEVDQINMLLHSFNTLETGVLLELDGKPIPNAPNLVDWNTNKRIDSVNGLVKIDLLHNQQIKNLSDYVNLLGELRSIIFNTKDKNELTTSLEQELGLQNIYLTFAYKSSAKSSDGSSTFMENELSVFTKGLNERTEWNGSFDVRSKEWNTKSIVAIIGTKENGNILELPLLTLNSPFTLIKAKAGDSYAFPEVLGFYSSLGNMNIHDKCVAVIQEAEKHPEWIKYKELIDLFKLYDFNMNGVFYINDNQWTPARNLRLEGPEIVNLKGYYLEAEGFGYDRNDLVETENDANWQSVEGFAANPQVTMTNHVYKTVSDKIDVGNDRTSDFIHKGHAFVIVSYDKNLDNDNKIFDYYLKQLADPNVPVKTKLVYVIPPKASFEEYFDNIKNIMAGSSTRKDIGSIFTSFRLLEILLTDNNFTLKLNTKMPGLVGKITEAMTNLHNASSKAEILSMLKSEQDWSDIGITTPVKLAGLFDLAIFNTVYNRSALAKAITGEVQVTEDKEGFDLITDILKKNQITGIRYRTFISINSHQVGPFVACDDAANTRLTSYNANGYYLKDGKPFLIHSKIDSYVFSGHMGDIVASMLPKIKEQTNKNGKNIKWSMDNTSYFKGLSNLDTKIDTKQIAIDKKVAELKNATGLDLAHCYDGVSIKEGNVKAFNELSLLDNDIMPILIDGDLVISPHNNILNGPITILNEGTPITDIKDLKNNFGEYVFSVDINGQEYNATYKPNTKELVLNVVIEEQLSNPVETIVTEEFFNLGKPLWSQITGAHSINPILNMLYGTLFRGDFDNFSTLLDTLFGSPTRLKLILKLLDTVTTPEEKEFINNMIKIELSKLDELNNTEGDVCSPDITIKF